MSLDQLIYVPAEAEADNHTVGAYIKASDGTEITHTGAALDVNIASGDLAIDIDIRDLAFAQDSVDVSGSEVSLDAATLAALETITVIATDLDIRNLVFATDKVDASGSEVSLDAATLAALETITVTATDLDIRDLTHVSDSTKIGDGTDFLAVNADGSINVNSTPGGFAALSAPVAKSVTSTVGLLIASPLANRKFLLIQNLGSKPCYIGADNTVTSINGIKVPAGGSVPFEFGPGITPYAITASGTADVRLLQAN